MSGFTLIEIAVALFILTLVVGTLLTPLATQVDDLQSREAERVMNEMIEALIGYAMSKTVPYLPCPDINNDGIEDRTGNACTTTDGNVPWVTLGVNATDPWGNRYRYLVSPNFSNSTTSPVTLTLASVGTIQICQSAPTDDTSCAGSTWNAANVPAAILSHGRNGYGAIINGVTYTMIPTNGASSDELENTPDGTQPRSLVSRPRTYATGAVFDDIVVWLSPNVLFNRLVAANRLP